MNRPLTAPMRVLRRHSAVVDRAVSRAHFARLLHAHEPVLIYSMGNAGTSSVHASLEAATGRPAVKVHLISEDGIARARLVHPRRSGILWKGEQLRREFRRPREWTVICGVRDPVARAVSICFSDGLVQRDTSIDAIADTIRAVAAEDWFDVELRQTTGVDVYAKPFDPSAGSATYQHGGFRVLLLRTEDLRRVAPHALAAHLGLDAPVTMVDRNLGADKASGSDYLTFLRTVKLPRHTVDAVYASRLARHFYTADELQAFTQRWCG